ncbi:hypothetical protein CU048_02975 [Beijerinckiaceae bacterium]|nr:hypothetical protein CU048_02975 [Beijerinckiaceae bacterium]
MQVESNEELYSVSIKGNGITIEKSVASHLARQMINMILGGTTTYGSVSPQEPLVSGNRTSGTSTAPPPGGGRTSLREFLDESQATRNPDKITAIAEYLIAHEGTESFTRDDIKGRFRTAGEAAPANFPRDFTWAVKNGWIAEDPKSPGSFYVTKKGRTAIENKFSDEVRKATAKPSTRKRLRKAGSTPSAEDDAK